MIVLQTLFKSILFEDDTIVDARTIIIVIVLPHGHLAMVGFRSAGDRGQQVVADRPHVEFIHLSASRWSNQADQLIVSQSDFLPSVKVVVIDRRLDPLRVFFFRLIE